jgi:hypothetical protein
MSFFAVNEDTGANQNFGTQMDIQVNPRTLAPSHRGLSAVPVSVGDNMRLSTQLLLIVMRR